MVGYNLFMKKDLNGQLKKVYELLLKNEKPMNREQILECLPNTFGGGTPLQSITRLMNTHSVQSDGNHTSYKGNKFLFDRIAPQTWIILDLEIAESLSRVIPLVEEEDQSQIVESVLRRKRTNPKNKQWILDNFPDTC